MTEDNHIVYAIKIAGLGVTNSDYGGDVDPADISSDPGPNTLLQRFTSTLCNQDPNQNVVRNYLMNLPNEIGYEIKPWESETITGTLNFSLEVNNITLPYFTRQNFPISGKLLVGIDDSETLLVTDVTDGSLEGSYYYIGRECIYFHTHEATAGEYTVSRGQLYSAAQAHVVALEYDTSIFEASRPHNLPGRRVEVVRFINGDGLIEDDEQLIWSGLIRDYSVDYANLVINVQSSSIEDALREGEICSDPWTGVLADFDYRFSGSDVNSTGYYESQDNRHPILQTVSTPRVDADGNVVNFSSGVFSDGTLTFTGRIVGAVRVVAPIDQAVHSQPTLFSKPRTELSNKIHEVYVLTSEPSDTLGNIIYNLLTRSDDRGLGIDVFNIEDNFIEKCDAILPRNAKPTELIVGIDGPENVYELIKNLLKPYLITLYVNASGNLDLLAYSDRRAIDRIKVVTNDDVVLESNLNYNPIAISPLSKVISEFGDKTGANQKNTVTVISPQVRARYLSTFASTDYLFFLGDVSELRTIAVSTNYSAFRAATRGTFRVELLQDKDFWPGDTLTCTHAEIPDADGSVATGGMVAETCTVLSRDYNHDEGIIRYKLLRGSAGIRRGSIHLSAKVVSYGSGDCYIDNDYFLTSGVSSQGWDDDLDAWNAVMQIAFDSGEVDFSVDIMDQYLTKIGTAKVYQVFTGGSGFLRLDSPSIDPVAGNFLIPTLYTSAESFLFSYFTYIGDDDATLGSTDAAYKWSI